MTFDHATFTREAARYLDQVYPERLERALATLPEGDLWWRPHARALSVGTILTHLEGNVRQWLLSGLGGLPDERDRGGEFATTGGRSAEALFARLRATTAQAAALVAALDGPALAAKHQIQGFEVDALSAVLHVVEHFSWHTGQVVWIAKARAGADHDIAFYDDAVLNAPRRQDTGGR